MDNEKSKVKKKPKFKRRQFLLKKLKNKWRRPRGLQNKLKLRKKGKGKIPRIGYGTKSKEKEFTLVKSLNDLENSKKDIIISSSIGTKKKIEIIKKSKELKLKILNIKDVDDFMKEVTKVLEENKKIKSEKKKKKEEKLKKKTEKKDEEKSKDDKEKLEKEEKKTVLEKGL